MLQSLTRQAAKSFKFKLPGKMSDINALITAQGDKLRLLKLDPTKKDEIAAAIKELMLLKATKSDSSDSKKKPGFNLKTPKGTRDFHPREMIVREKIFSTISSIFKTHGAVTIDTPVFELRDILAGKYGEDSKLIFDLADQGGEICSLRYDLTVPFARYLASNPGDIKRYHIAKVYRRDQPAVTKGRMREFYQCDFDIAGNYDPMLPDSEILLIVTEILSALDVGEFKIKFNHRKILDGVFSLCGVSEDKIRTISSAVDKLDKAPWAEVRKEMLEKGLTEQVADHIWEYVQLKGGIDLVKKLQSDEKFMNNPSAAAGVKDVETLFEYLSVYKMEQHVSFDLSLARGLDYYTGLIYEAVVAGSAPPPKIEGQKPVKVKKGEEDELDESTVGVGSIAAGGRYDELVAMFSTKERVPCVGISFGVERIFSILMQKENMEKARTKETQVFVMSLGRDGLVKERMTISKMLWDSGIKTEFMYKLAPKGVVQFNQIDRDQIPFAVMVGKSEWETGVVLVKDQNRPQDSDGSKNTGEIVKLEDLISYLKARM